MELEGLIPSVMWVIEAHSKAISWDHTQEVVCSFLRCDPQKDLGVCPYISREAPTI
jgi:hypothetical protein